MKMTSRDKELLFLALSLGIVAASYFGGARLLNKKTEELTSRKEALQSEYDERVRILEKKEQYIKDTKDYNDAYTLMMGHYPAGLPQDQQIMFVVGLEDQFNTQVTSLSYTDEMPLYQFQSVEPENSSPYILTTSTLQIPVELEYSRFKELLDYVFTYKEKNIMPEVTAAFEPATNRVIAQVNLKQFAIQGEDRETVPPKITVPIGTDNIFKTGSNLSYDGDRAEKIEDVKKNYDCYIMLYPSASDVKAKVIAGPEEEEKVISESNEEEELTIVAEQTGAACSITYTLGDNRPHALQGIEGDTLDIYVLSSSRMGSTDLSGVKVRIENRTEKTMRIAVSDEDALRPRFIVEQQEGYVEILK